MKQEVTDLVKDFFGWEPELKPVLPYLKKRVAKAVFWQEVPGVIAVSKNPVLFWSGRRISLWQKLESELGQELRGSLTKAQLEEISLWLEENLPFGPKQGGPTIEDKLWENLKKLWYTLDGLEHQYILRREMQQGFWYSLFMGAGFCLAGNKEKNFKPLLSLWLKGNFPAWFDRQGRLIILCAPLEVQSYNHCGSVSGLLTGQAANP